MTLEFTLNHDAPAQAGVDCVVVGAYADKSLTSAGSGGRPRTQELLDFCGEHGIIADIEVIPIQKIEEAYDGVGTRAVRNRTLRSNETGTMP